MKPRSAIVLSVAGSDSIAGAGIQADLRTLSALGGYACTAITAVTVQNSKGVRSINPVKPKIISEQILAILEDFKVGAVKTGLIPNEASVRSIAQSLKKYPKIPLIISTFSPTAPSIQAASDLLNTGIY